MIAMCPSLALVAVINIETIYLLKATTLVLIVTPLLLIAIPQKPRITQITPLPLFATPLVD